jgi:hypothetical protein
LEARFSVRAGQGEQAERAELVALEMRVELEELVALFVPWFAPILRLALAVSEPLGQGLL